ncbi:hypothetical protein [Aquisphaera insulae]|uniref:hypothetical protein n=1 Tax=Aquisphaera insulae TaxID=2712864 RepID=UPI0013ECF7C9|nr:hypothetical protein [Aquisphaera insulae]
MEKCGANPPTVKALSSRRFNPFDEALEPERATIWEMLVARDNEAFVSEDWSLVAGDFWDERFEGISANGSTDPAAWTLTYPTLDAYRRDWLRMAGEFLRTPLVDGDHLGLLYAMTTLDRFEFRGDRLLVWKRFRAESPLEGGGELSISLQSIFRLHRDGDRWRIVGFIGYLPLEAGT